jgi:hypothetical protein
LIGAPIAVPPALKTLLDHPTRSEPIAADDAALRAHLLAPFR